MTDDNKINDVTDSIWSLQVIIIYDASWEKVFHC